MPIDLRRIRRDPSFLESLKNSSSTRSQQDLSSRILELDALERKSLKELNAYRTKVNKRQAQDKNYLNSLQRQHSENLQGLEEALLRLGNVVDEFGDEYAPEAHKPQPPDSSQCNVKDPFFCIGGYEDWGQQAVLTGLGMNLMKALHCYVATEVESWSPHSSILELAESINISNKDYHEMWGYEEDGESSKVNSPLTTKAPSWMTLVRKQHDGQTYYDRRLPIYNILSVICDSSLIDKREKWRHSSWGSSREWHRRLAVSKMIQVVVLTGSSCKADSRPLQMELLQRTKDLYQRLVYSKEVDIWIEAIPAKNLLPAESSRLVLWSILPGQPKPVCLAYLSNLQDYASSGIRHGNTPQYCHILTGTLCSLPYTLEWIMQHCATNEFVKLPKVLSAPEVIKYRRKVVINKKGKKMVQAMVNENKDDRQQKTGHGVFGKPSPDDIRMEALSSPFDFLPFYYT